MIFKSTKSDYNNCRSKINCFAYQLRKDSASSKVINVVPIGAYFGKGKNAGRVSSFLIAIYDPEHQVYYPVGKASLGLGNQDWEELDKIIDVSQLSEQPENVISTPSLKPDMWLETNQLWKVKYSGIKKSPFYTMRGESQIEVGFVIRSCSISERKAMSEDPNEWLKDVTTQAQLIKNYIDQ
jgi:DNA ligase-1